MEIWRLKELPVQRALGEMEHPTQSLGERQHSAQSLGDRGYPAQSLGKSEVLVGPEHIKITFPTYQRDSWYV